MDRLVITDSPALRFLKHASQHATYTNELIRMVFAQALGEWQAEEGLRAIRWFRNNRQDMYHQIWLEVLQHVMPIDFEKEDFEVLSRNQSVSDTELAVIFDVLQHSRYGDTQTAGQILDLFRERRPLVYQALRSQLS